MKKWQKKGAGASPKKSFRKINQNITIKNNEIFGDGLAPFFYCFTKKILPEIKPSLNDKK